ncbi:MAG: hypothetical protein MUE30_06595 [Spirosomaceae bacterium]|jgi:hypothetical protein|nr:hypothetical protein [Spirosomataceae bacterium]
MSNVQDIEAAIKRLSSEELNELSSWFEMYQAKQWDEKITQDLANGKLNNLILKAKNAYQQGSVKEI